ncbi:MAG: quinol:electron acceptor oxidoreductase subunit ActD, partial [Bdellovibrionota bacterium]
PAFVPIMFEATVLFAGLATVGAMFLLNGLPNLRRKIFDPAITRDKFALVIEAPLPVEEDDEAKKKKSAAYKKFEESEAANFLKSAGAVEVRTVYAEGWF